MMVPLHADNGIYLLITPGDPALRVQVDGGLMADTAGVPENSALLLPGKAFSDWLLKGTQFQSRVFGVPHEVPKLNPGQPSRAVYGRMRVAAMDATPLTAGEVWWFCA